MGQPDPTAAWDDACQVDALLAELAEFGRAVQATLDAMHPAGDADAANAIASAVAHLHAAEECLRELE